MLTKKKKIIFLNKYSHNGASSRMRSYQFESYFSQGWEVEYLPLFTEKYLANKYSTKSVKLEVLTSYLRRFYQLFKLTRADIVWIEKEAFPYLPFCFFEQIIFWLSKKVIVDYDDAIFHNYDDDRYSIIRSLLGRKIDKIMAHSDLVIAGNNYLADRARAAGAKRIEIVPTVIPVARYPEIKQHPNNPLPVIGWIGTPMTQKFLLEIESVLDELYSRHPFKLHLIGISEEFWNNKPYRVRVQWSEREESTELSKIDIGIMPLTNNKFEQGKCGFKLIQYMGCSKPIVASPVGVNSVIVSHGVNGYLCEDKSQWGDALQRLISDRELRQRMGLKGRQDFVEKFTQEYWGKKLVEMAQITFEKSA